MGEHKETFGELIECPACGFIDKDSWEHGPMDKTEWDEETRCSSCDARLYVSRSITVRYSARVLESEKEHSRG